MAISPDQFAECKATCFFGLNCEMSETIERLDGEASAAEENIALLVTDLELAEGLAKVCYRVHQNVPS